MPSSTGTVTIVAFEYNRVEIEIRKTYRHTPTARKGWEIKSIIRLQGNRCRSATKWFGIGYICCVIHTCTWQTHRILEAFKTDTRKTSNTVEKFSRRFSIDRRTLAWKLSPPYRCRCVRMFIFPPRFSFFLRVSSLSVIDTLRVATAHLSAEAFVLYAIEKLDTVDG